MKRIGILIAAAVAALTTSCSTTKQILYFQNLQKDSVYVQDTPYEAVIKKDDRLVIIVSGPDKTVVAPYNFTLGDLLSSASTNPESSTLSYLVDSKGNIDFPILGTIHVEGMTRNELVAYLTEAIGRDVKNPVVYVTFKNYKITVIGEVQHPGTFNIDSEKINILQAIGEAGDLSLTARRDGITLFREEGGEIKHYTFDLRDTEILSSPYFYLQQNDVLYIPPSPIRVANATAASGILGTFVSSISLLIAIISFLR